MSNLIDRYINRVLFYANKTEAEAGEIRQEMKDHLLQKVEDLSASGLPREEAVIRALREHGHPAVIGNRLRTGFPWVDIRVQGTARGVIAIGPRAVGIFAFGGVAMGVFTCGGVSLGLFSAGGLAVGLLMAWGGFSVGGISFGGMAIGLAAMGGMAVGLVAVGGEAIGAWVPQSWNAHSFYTAENVPAFIKSMEPLLAVPGFISRHMGFIMTVYLLGVGALSFIQIRAGSKVNRQGKDWLLED